jgi:hypothetical protein
LALIVNTPVAWAISLIFSPVNQTIDFGAQAVVEVRVAGLGANSPPNPIVGEYDFNVLYDASILGFAGIAFGTHLGGPGDSIQDSISSPGVLNAAELSLLANTALAGLQDSVAEFVLFTLTFNAIGEGVSALSFSGNIAPSNDFLGDEQGNAIPSTSIQLGTGAIIVNPRPIPEPAPLALLVLGIVGMAGTRQCRRAMPR